MDIIRFGKIDKCRTDKQHRVKCMNCGTKVRLRESELISNSNTWKCPFCEHINMLETFWSKCDNFFHLSAKIGKLVFAPITILVLIIIGTVVWIKEGIDFDGVATLVGYIFVILLGLAVVSFMIGEAVACFKFGFFSIANC